MNLLTIACLGFFLIAAILYSLMGGGTLCIFLVLVAIVIAVLSALDNDNTPPGENRSFIDKIKPYRCRWCKKCFWTSKGTAKHKFEAHPILTRQEMAQARAQLENSKRGYPTNLWRECTWCEGSGWKHGVRCDWCGGSGKLPR